MMREFLYSEISQIEGIPNIPDEPELAIAAGKQFNITWSENSHVPKSIDSHMKNPHTDKKDCLTKKGIDDFSGSHEQFYREFVDGLLM